MKWVCSVCGYVYEGSEAPEFCPSLQGSPRQVCRAEPRAKRSGPPSMWSAWPSDVPEEIKQGLRENFTGECTEVGMYLAMARAAHREGYPEIGLYWEKAAYEEAEHAAKFAELLGEVVSASTKENLTDARGSRKRRHRRQVRAGQEGQGS